MQHKHKSASLEEQNRNKYLATGLKLSEVHAPVLILAFPCVQLDKLSCVPFRNVPCLISKLHMYFFLF